MTKASKFVSLSLRWPKLVKIPSVKNILSDSIYEPRIVKIYLLRKAKLGYSLTCSFHQSKGDLTSSLEFVANNEKETT